MCVAKESPVGTGRMEEVERPSPVFNTTHWSVVLAAGNELSPESDAALETLCKTYWYPLYAYVRRRGFSNADAQDLTQAFFEHLLERNAFHRLSPAKGKFRSFLLAAFNYFINDSRDRASAQKRGGGFPVISFDSRELEVQYQSETIDDSSPERVFEKRWALTLLDQVLVRLEREFSGAGREAQFKRLSDFLVGNDQAGTHAEAARDLGLTQEAVKKAVQRMRRRYGVLFREEIAKTVAKPSQVEEELRSIYELIVGAGSA